MSVTSDQIRPDRTIARNSSLELLRIVGMLAIVASHFSVHGGFNFPTNSITANRLWIQLIRGGGVGNGIFVMLSGYFLINSHEIKFRKLFNLWTRIFFWSIVVYCAFLISGAKTLHIKDAVKAFLPITRQQWWFVTTYFVVYLIHPYVNKLLHSFTREEYRKFLLSIMLYWCIVPTFLLSDFGANRTINFLCLYSLAGYIRLFPDDFYNRATGRRYILWGLGFFGVNFLLIFALDIVGLWIPIVGRYAGYVTGMMRPFTILSASCLLLGFCRINITQNRIINTIASATFGVYLIHEHALVRHLLWHEVFRNASFSQSPYLIPYSLAAIVIVFFICTVIELLRSKLFKMLSGGKLS